MIHKNNKNFRKIVNAIAACTLAGDPKLATAATLFLLGELQVCSFPALVLRESACCIPHTADIILVFLSQRELVFLSGSSVYNHLYAALLPRAEASHPRPLLSALRLLSFFPPFFSTNSTRKQTGEETRKQKNNVECGAEANREDVESVMYTRSPRGTDGRDVARRWFERVVSSGTRPDTRGSCRHLAPSVSVGLQVYESLWFLF